MSEKKGTQALQALILLIVSIVQAFVKARKDGKISFTDAYHLAGVIKPALEFAKYASEVMAEIQDLDAQEKAFIVQDFSDRFELPNQEVEEKVEKIIGYIVEWGPKTGALVGIVKGFFDKEDDGGAV